jgi:hypothetical protein
MIPDRQRYARRVPEPSVTSRTHLTEKGKQLMRKLILVLGFLFVALPAKANDIYFTQNGTGTGTSCSNPENVAYFNNSANWGTGKPIVPGTTLHLCGTFTGTAGQQLLVAHGSGTSTSPITIKFETGAVLTAPYWSSQGTIYENGLSYITIDGGTNGLIENTANGTGLANQQSTRAIYAPGCTGCVIQNLTIANLYVHSSPSDVTLANASDVNCIYFSSTSNNVVVNNLTCHDAGWAITGPGNNSTIENSNLYNVDHGVAWGASGTITGVSIHDNHIHDFANWDTGTADKYHHDGLHLWGHVVNSVPNNINGGVIYNNLFDGDPGACCHTAFIFLQDSIQNIAVFNNSFIEPSGSNMTALWFAGASNSNPMAGGTAAYNNYVQGGGVRTSGAGISIDYQSNFTALNNIAIGGQSDLGMNLGTRSSSGINNNLYDDLFTDYGDTNVWNYNPGTGEKTYKTLATWQAACACDGQSLVKTYANMLLNSTGVPQTGSPAIGLGQNLTNIATGSLAPLAKDKNGVSRPTTGAWTVGAYQPGTAHQISKVQVINPAALHASSLAATLPTETAGDFLIAVTAYQLPGTTVTLTDTLGNTWTHLTAYNNSNCGNTDGNYSGAQIWYAENIKGGANTVTMQVNAATYIWVAVVEYSGIKTSGSLAASNGFVATTSSNSISAGNVTATGSNNLIFGFFHDEFQNTSMTAGSGYVDEANASLTAMIEDNFSAAMGTYNPSANYTNGSDACGVATDAAFASQ